MIIKALRAKYKYEIASAKANIEVYRNNPVGVGEHPDLVSAVDCELKKLTDDFFPLIAFQKNGEVRLVKSRTADGILSVYDQSGKMIENADLAKFEKEFSGFAIIAKELNAREKEDRSGTCSIRFI